MFMFTGCEVRRKDYFINFSVRTTFCGGVFVDISSLPYVFTALVLPESIGMVNPFEIQR